MEDSDEIEDFYGKESEKLDLEFLNKFESKKNEIKPVELELNYHQNVNKLIDNYNTKYSKYLDVQKNIEKNRDWIKEHEKEKKENEEQEKDDLDMSKPFKVVSVDLEPPLREKINTRLDLLKFKTKILKGKILQNYIPTSIIIHFFKLKLFLRSFKAYLENNFSNISNWISNGFRNSLENSKESARKTLTTLKTLETSSIKIRDKILGKGKKEEKPSNDGNEPKSSTN